MGVAHVTVVEYNLLTYTHPHISTVTPSLLEPAAQFDCALSISRSSVYIYTCIIDVINNVNAALTMMDWVAMGTPSIQLVTWLQWTL